MSPSPGECSRLEKRRIRAEAAAWIALLHGRNRTPALEQGLRRWLAEHPLHAREFELATDVWDESGGHGRDVHRNASRFLRPAAIHRLIRPVVALTAAVILIAAWLIHAASNFQVSTGIGEQKTLILSDGTRLTLNTSTRAVVQYTKDARTVILKTGEAYFDVVHNAARPFIVRAGDHKVIDLGTRFIVNRAATGGNALTVTVIEGQVAVAPIATADAFHPQTPVTLKIVSAGQLLRITPHLSPVIRSISAYDATAWLNGQLVFDGTPLSEAAKEFNRYSSIKIRVFSPEVERIPVGGVFRIGDSKSFARAVAESNHLALVVGRHELILDRLHTTSPPEPSTPPAPSCKHIMSSSST